MVTTKRKRVSKKNKKSWRKNVDISDVDNFLEDQRLEERLGVKYAEQKDEDLFELDTKGEDENQRSPLETIRHHNQPSTTNLVIKSSMRLSEEKTPKNYEILEKRSAVPAAIKVTKHAKAKDINNKFLKRKLAVGNCII